MSAAELALTGVVTRTSFYDGDVDQFVPKMTVQQVADGRTRLRVTRRAFRQGIRTRLEWPDGDPARVFDGTSVAQSHYFPADTFFVPGPGRSREEAALSHRQWSAHGVPADLPGRGDGRLIP